MEAVATSPFDILSARYWQVKAAHPASTQHRSIMLRGTFGHGPEGTIPARAEDPERRPTSAAAPRRHVRVKLAGALCWCRGTVLRAVERVCRCGTVKCGVLGGRNDLALAQIW